MKNRMKLYFFGLSLGFKSIFKLRKISGRILEMLIVPMNYWRYIETPLILNSLSPKKGELILDLGSPKLLSFYLAKKVGAKVIASDLNNYFVGYCKEFSHVLGIDQNYQTRIIDARKIPLKDGSVDKVFALSVFEHIPNEGDMLAMKEVKRVLKKGGVFSLTVPYGDKFENEYKDSKDFYYSSGNKSGKNKKVFYQRKYDEKELVRRIIKSSGMKLVKKEYVGQRFKPSSSNWNAFLGPFNVLYSVLNHVSPKANLRDVKNPSMVHVVVRK